jgi:hypothetical protein
VTGERMRLERRAARDNQAKPRAVTYPLPILDAIEVEALSKGG